MLLMHHLISWISHYVQGFIHVWWCRISSINSIMYVIPLVCRVFPEREWKIGRCFWPAGSQNHIRKNCTIFPMETCESLWSEGVGILHKSYGPILHILCKWPLLVTFWVPGDSGKGPCASCTTARTPQEVFEDVYHWHPLICQKRMDFECVPPRKMYFSLSKARICTIQDVRQQKLIFLPKMLLLQTQQRGRQVGPTWTIIESWSFPGFIADKRNASDQSQTQDGQWQEIWKNLQITGGFMWATIWGSYW